MFKTINEGTLPTRATKFSAAVDVYANETIIINSGDTEIIPLGICIDSEYFQRMVPPYASGKDLDDDRIDHFKSRHYLQLEPRSSLRAKGLQSGTGIIDLDYPDELKLILRNPLTSTDVIVNDSYTVNRGDRIGQILLLEHNGHLLGIESNETRTGGLGSTDVHAQ